VKTIVITGASSGVGRALAIHFAKQDWNVAAIARNADKLQEVKSECSDNIHTYICDISKSGEVRNAFDEILAAYPTLDVLVNNAGLVTPGNMDEDDLSVIDLGIDINLKGTMYCTGAAVPAMKKAGAGLIINIASIAGLPGGIGSEWIAPGITKYCTYGTSPPGTIRPTSSVLFSISFKIICCRGDNFPKLFR